MNAPGKIDGLIQQLESNHEQGALFFAEKALDIMALASEQHIGENAKEMLRDMWRIGKRLIEIRPSMSAAMIHAVTSLWESVLGEFLANPAICPLKGWVREKKNQILKRLNNAVESSTENAARIIPENAKVFLLSYSSSIIAAMKKDAPKKIKAIVAESRPLCEGVKTAEECAKLGIETTLITDSQMGLFIKDCSLVLVGADAILPSGDIVNKAGTSVAASIASAHKIPFHVIATTHKIHSEQTIPLEEKLPDEILSGTHPFAIRNIYFDITPACQITSIITEKGSLSPSQISSLAAPIQKSCKSFLSNPLSV